MIAMCSFFSHDIGHRTCPKSYRVLDMNKEGNIKPHCGVTDDVILVKWFHITKFGIKY